MSNTVLPQTWKRLLDDVANVSDSEKKHSDIVDNRSTPSEHKLQCRQ